MSAVQQMLFESSAPPTPPPGIDLRCCAYALAYGPFDESLHVLHRCDTPLCVNPAHLFLGTNADNQRDKALKGRSLYGRKNASAKLTVEQVLEIRARAEAGETHVAISRDYPVGTSQIGRIIHRQKWSHV